jgi:hypothetical protein
MRTQQHIDKCMSTAREEENRPSRDVDELVRWAGHTGTQAPQALSRRHSAAGTQAQNDGVFHA